ncbi:MAG: DUF3105 domain-containing protein [Dehalococcoidia bacterium]
MSRRRGGGTPPPTKSFWQKYQWFIIAGVAMFFIITVVAPALSTPPEDTTQPNTGPSDTTTTTVPGELFFQASNVDGRTHVPRGTRVTTYRSDPPVSGPHWSDANAPIPWGVYPQPIPDEVLIHNLEHGGIVIHYRSSADPVIRQQLEEFVQNQPGGTEGFILAPRNNLPATITMSGWEYYLPLFQINEPLMRNFISAHYDQGPEALSGGSK